MKELGISSVVFIVIGFGLLLFIMFIPLPHYNQDQGWYQGPSVAARLLGANEPGAPVEQVYFSLIQSSIKSPFELSCLTDEECTTYNVANQCRSYCASQSDQNADTTKQLGNNRVCDPAGWRPEKLNCRCILKKCIEVSY